MSRYRNKTFFLLLLLPYVVQAEAAPRSDDVSLLSLAEALDQALNYNLGLTIARYEPAKQADAVAIEASVYDVELFASTQYRDHRAATDSETNGSQSEQARVTTGLDKRFQTGASVRLGTGASRSQTDTNGALDEGASGDLSLSLRQPLLRGAGSRINLAPLARAKVKEEQSIEVLRAQILDFITQVEISYWDLAFSQAALTLVNSNLELAESLLEENQERERLGLVTQLEVMQARTEFLKQQENSILAERAVQDDQDRLMALMGVVSLTEDTTPELRPVQALQASPRFSLPALSVVVAKALAVDADTKVQYKEIEVARLNQLLAKDLTQPQLDLTAGVDYLGSDEKLSQAYTDAYRGDDGYDWSVGLELRLPWGGREARARYRRATRTLEQQELRLHEIRETKARLARSAWRAVQSGTQRVEVTQAAIALNEQSFEQERARYGAGLSAYRQVLEAQRDLDKARRSHLQALIDQRRAVVQLARVDGSILERNGFTWAEADALLAAPRPDQHPVVGETISQEQTHL